MLWDMAQQLLGGNGNANAKESPGAAVDDESKGVLDSVMGAVDGAQKIAGMIPGGNTVAGPLLKSLGVGLKIGSFIDDKLKISDNLAGVTPEKLDEHYRGVGGVERQKTRGAAGIADAEEAQKRNDPIAYYTEMSRREVVKGRQKAAAPAGAQVAPFQHYAE